MDKRVGSSSTSLYSSIGDDVPEKVSALEKGTYKNKKVENKGTSRILLGENDDQVLDFDDNKTTAERLIARHPSRESIDSGFESDGAESSSLNDDQKITANRLLNDLDLSRADVRKACLPLLGVRLEHKGVDPMSLEAEGVEEEMKLMLLDLRDRGLNLGQGQDKNKLELNIKKVKDFANQYNEVLEMDNQLERYIKNGNCQTWDEDIPLYRGGDFKYNSKLERNMKKHKKDIFHPEKINVGGEICSNSRRLD